MDLAEIEEAIPSGEELIGLPASVIRTLRLEAVADELPTLRQRRVAHRQACYGAGIAAIERVRGSWWMDEVYSLLAEAFAEDDEEAQARKVRGFVQSACGAWISFEPYRNDLDLAGDLRREIAETAALLARQLRAIEAMSVECPDEFSSVPCLLGQTDHPNEIDLDFHPWRVLRGTVLGEPPRRDRAGGEEEQPQGEGETAVAPIVEIRFLGLENEEPHGVVERPDYPEERAWRLLCYGWSKAPPVAAMLDALANAARQFKPSQDGFIGAAVESRQKNPKLEYIRAFAALLTDNYKLSMTPLPIRKAMARIATVIIGDPNVEVTYDDVSYTLKGLSGYVSKYTDER